MGTAAEWGRSGELGGSPISNGESDGPVIRAASSGKAQPAWKVTMADSGWHEARQTIFLVQRHESEWSASIWPWLPKTGWQNKAQVGGVWHRIQWPMTSAPPASHHSQEASADQKLVRVLQNHQQETGGPCQDNRIEPGGDVEISDPGSWPALVPTQLASARRSRCDHEHGDSPLLLRRRIPWVGRSTTWKGPR